MKLANYKIGVRLGFAFAIVVLLMAIASAMALRSLSSVQDNLEDVVTDNNLKIRLNHEMSAAVHEISRVIPAMVFLKDKALIEQEQAKLFKARQDYDKSWQQLQKIPADETGKANRARIDAAKENTRLANDKVLELVQAGNGAEATASLLREARPATDKFQEAIQTNIAFQEESSKREYEESVGEYRSARNLLIGINAAGLILCAFAGWLVTRSITQPLRRAVDIAGNIANDNLNNDVMIEGKDEAAELILALSRMQSNLRQRAEADRKIADEMARIKIALDNVSTGVMIANTDREIIYVNGSVTRILKSAESEIRKALPGFNADKLIGVNIDSFHKNPRHQADLLGSLSKVHSANFKIGTRHMVVTVNPVINAQNERLGSVAEWLDRTSEALAEEEVAGMVQGAMMGDFNARVAIEGKEGFFKILAEGLNRLAETTSHGLNDVARVLRAVAHGDLTDKIESDYAGIFGQLRDDANSTVERLREVIGRIKEASEAINIAAQEISAGNTDLSSRTEEQASSLEETASSMEELNSTVKQNAENANHANNLARSSNDIAVKSGQMVQQIVSTMTGISDSSKKIADIIGVIDSIAFQTNILALNAAVEAARAGEQGRGFAVVASEVRNLAQRSATAAKEIKELIVESGGKVDAGTKLVDQAGLSMNELVGSFQQVAVLVTDIANASREQSCGIEQVTQAVGQMDEVTQQNAALVEESAAAAESLEEQAHGLVQAVAMFKLAEEGGDAHRRRPAALASIRPTKRMTAPAGRASPPTTRKTALAHMPAYAEEEWAEF